LAPVATTTLLDSSPPHDDANYRSTIWEVNMRWYFLLTRYGLPVAALALGLGGHKVGIYGFSRGA